MEKQFSLVSDFSQLTEKEKELIIKTIIATKTPTQKILEELQKYDFSGIREKNSLISFILYKRLKTGFCFVKIIYGKQNKNFTKIFGVTPATYLIEHLIRKGIKRFAALKLTPKGRRFVQGKIRKGKLAKVPNHGLVLTYETTQKWIATAHKRKLF